MEVVLENDQFIVIDNFLSEEDHNAVWMHFQTSVFVPGETGGFRGIWRLDDGSVMRGPDIAYGEHAQKMTEKGTANLSYPTGHGIDSFIKTLSSKMEDFEPWLGKRDKDWSTFVCTPRLNPRNTSLYWHRDSPDTVCGSLTYYAHPKWNCQWGGEIFIAHPDTQNISNDYGPYLRKPRKIVGYDHSVAPNAHLDNSEANEILMEKGVGQFVMCKPNRLVVIKTGNPHMVNKVQPAAGDNVRSSITAFVIRSGFEPV